MSLIYTVNSTERVGRQKVVTGTVQFDSSYPTGGEPFSFTSVGLASLESLHVAGAGGYVLVWNNSTSSPSIIAYQGDNDNAADAPGNEVPGTTNLASAITGALFVARGK